MPPFSRRQNAYREKDQKTLSGQPAGRSMGAIVGRSVRPGAPVDVSGL